MDTAFDGAFLMEQMELRERLAAVKEGDDPHLQLQKITRDIDVRVKEITEELAILFTENNDASLGKARDLTRKMQFFRKLEQETDALDDDLDVY